MIRNTLLSLILSITILVTVFSFTILNNNYQINIVNEYKTNNISLKDFKISNKYYVYIVDIGLIIVTGEIFIHTKKKHNIDKIYIISFIISVFIYGILYILLNNNNLGVYYSLKRMLHYYLGIEIILFEYVLFKKHLLNKIIK